MTRDANQPLWVRGGYAAHARAAQEGCSFGRCIAAPAAPPAAPHAYRPVRPQRGCWDVNRGFDIAALSATWLKCSRSTVSIPSLRAFSISPGPEQIALRLNLNTAGWIRQDRDAGPAIVDNSLSKEPTFPGYRIRDSHRPLIRSTWSLTPTTCARRSAADTSAVRRDFADSWEAAQVGRRCGHGARRALRPALLMKRWSHTTDTGSLSRA
jgi:hypothetical protein